MFGEFFEVVGEDGGRPLSMDKSIKWRKMTDWILINTRNWRINDERIKGDKDPNSTLLKFWDTMRNVLRWCYIFVGE